MIRPARTVSKGGDSLPDSRKKYKLLDRQTFLLQARKVFIFSLLSGIMTIALACVFGIGNKMMKRIVWEK